LYKLRRPPGATFEKGEFQRRKPVGNAAEQQGAAKIIAALRKTAQGVEDVIAG
jgi:hypothetical protein